MQLAVMNPMSLAAMANGLGSAEGDPFSLVEYSQVNAADYISRFKNDIVAELGKRVAAPPPYFISYNHHNEPLAAAANRTLSLQPLAIPRYDDLASSGRAVRHEYAASKGVGDNHHNNERDFEERELPSLMTSPKWHSPYKLTKKSSFRNSAEEEGALGYLKKLVGDEDGNDLMEVGSDGGSSKSKSPSKITPIAEYWSQLSPEDRRRHRKAFETLLHPSSDYWNSLSDQDQRLHMSAAEQLKNPVVSPIKRKRGATDAT
jgi:hypothetical protein